MAKNMSSNLIFGSPGANVGFKSPKGDYKTTIRRSGFLMFLLPF